MKSCVVALAACIAAPTTGLQVVTKNSLSNPTNLGQVVKLLQGIADKSKQEAEDDRKLWATEKCECDKEGERLSGEIKSAEAESEELATSISSHQGKNGAISVQIQQLKEDLESVEESLEAATTRRTEDRQTATEQQDDLKNALDQLEKALNALAAVGADQSQQSSAHAQVMKNNPVFAQLHGALSKALIIASASMDTSKNAEFASFLQQNPFGGNYAARSGGIFGILKGMKDTFASNLQASIQQEEKDEKAFVQFTDEKTKAKDKMEALLESRKNDAADTDASLTSARAKLETRKEDLKNHITAAADLKTECAAKEEGYNARSKDRASADAAISKAISILNSDAAFETFQGAQTWGNFLQVVSKKAHPFAGLFQAVNQTINKLKDEHESDQLLLKQCEEQEASHIQSTEKLSQDINKADETITAQTALIKDPTTGHEAMIQSANENLQDNRVDQAAERETRVSSSQGYQERTKDLAGSIKLIDGAVSALKEHFGESFAAIGALKDIKTKLADSLKTEHDTEVTEQGNFEARLTDLLQEEKDTETSRSKSVANLAVAQENLKASKEDKASAEEQKKAEAKIFEDVEKRCKWVRENKQLREDNRNKELAALDLVKEKVRDTAKFQEHCKQAQEDPLCQQSTK